MLVPDPSRKKLKTILEERSQEVLQRFKQMTVSDFSNVELISILEDVNKHWKDLQRPALASFSCEAVGGKPSAADDASLVITLASAGMGIHDDIIDKSDNKHLRKTILGKYGEDKALLVGDLLIIKGLTTAQARLERTCPNENKEAVLQALKNFIFEIYEGELMDILCRKKLDTDLDDYLGIIRKLAADGEACSRVGAILGGGSQDEIQALSEFGRRLGIVIILGEEVRDTLNVEGNLPHRIEHESVPLPVLFAAKSSEQAYSEVKSILQNPSTASHAFDITELCWKAKAFTYVSDVAKKNASEAVRKLEMLKPSSAKDVLSFMIEVALGDIKKARSFERQYTKYVSR